jgi:membrane protein
MLQMMRQRLFSFLMVIGVCLLLVVSAAIGLLISWLSSIAILEGFQSSLTVAGFIVLATLSFGVMYKLLPEVKIAWRDVWLGALISAALVTLGGLLIAFFMKNTRLSSALEAAGAFVVLLTGFFYFAQILLFRAVLTRVYAQRYGSMRRLTGENHP